jgi:hypothetical protein
MLTFCIVIFFGLSGPRAQTFTQVSYNFPSAPDHATDDTVSCSTSLTMNCLAANGTGQWTSFPDGENGNWALLGNHLEDPASDCSYHGGIVQTGMLANVIPANPDEMKVAANLMSSVRYVCPDPTRDYFVMQGLDYADIGGSIDFSFKSGTNGMTLSDPTSTLLVKTPMITYSTTISTFCGGSYHPVVTSSIENPRDEFDIAIDLNYVYIVWEASDGIFATVINMLDGSVPMGFPVQLGSGFRPTVAVNVRYGGVGNVISFDAAWIGSAASAAIYYRSMVHGVLGPIYTLSSWMQHPGQPDANYSPTHARILVASYEGAFPASPNDPRAIYAIVGAGSTSHLVLFKDVQRYALGGSWTPEHAIYFDGMWALTPHPAPIDGFFPVDDDPIIAFANPYDGQGQYVPPTPGTTPFNEYHCLYRLLRGYGGDWSHNPPMIVRGADRDGTPNAMNQCMNLPVPGWETLNLPDAEHQFSEDPAVDANGVVSYVGAVNQMGIHVHWRSYTGHHYYMRDSRAFDENIEENTLETYSTVVRDGSDHDWGGIANYPTWSSTQVVLWCEPSTNEFAAIPGSAHAPILNFEGTGAELQVYASILIAFPSFKVNFTDASQSLQDYMGRLEYYGNSISGSQEHFSFSGSGPSLPTVELIGGGVTEMSSDENGYPLALDNPANLYIHGGCWFTTTTSINFSSTASIIYCIHEPEVGSLTGAVGDGVDYCIGPQTIMTSIISGGTAGLPTYEPSAIMIRPCTMLGGATQFSMTNSLLQNIGTAGGIICDARLDPSNTSLPYNSVSISGGEFYGARLLFADPSEFITVSNTIFDNIDPAPDPTWGTSGAIYIHNPTHLSGTGFNLMQINNCDFRDWPTGGGGDGAIVVSGFGYRPGGSTDASNILIEDNSFVTAASEGAGSINSAIWVESSAGRVAGNVINKNIYEYGIYHTGDAGKMPSFICSNQISNINADALTATGLFLGEYNGYAKLNVIKNCNVGVSDAIDDKGDVDFADIENSSGYGMDIYGHPDLTGVHHPTDPSSDYGAFNVIKNNDGGNIQIHLNSYALVDLGKENPLWTVFGFNDIEGSYDVYADDGLLADIADISSNFWGSPITPSTNATFTDVLNLPLPAPTSPSVSCSDGTDDKTKQKHPLPLSMQGDSSSQYDSSSCLQLLYVGESYGEDDGNAQIEVDTLEYFVEHCYAQPFSYEAFDDIDGAVAQEELAPNFDTSWERFAVERNWLFSVLYLNMDTLYYCHDADALIATFVYPLGPRGLDFKGQKAVEEYIIHSGKCPMYVSEFNSQIKELNQQIYLSWKDTVKDSLTEPFDSTLPTLQQIGFEALLGPQYAAVHNGIIPSSVLGNIGVAPNPFTDNTVIDYTLNVPATLTVEVFNVLGQRVASPVPSVFTTNGDCSLTLTGSSLASGTYYVRFSVPEGEVRTVILTKE